jgi:hypothetical protein
VGRATPWVHPAWIRAIGWLALLAWVRGTGAVARTLLGCREAPGGILGGRAGAALRSDTHPQPRGVRRVRASTQSLMDCILESFAFLHADLASEDLSLFSGSQGPR